MSNLLEKRDIRSFVFVVHKDHGLLLLYCMKKRTKGPHWQVPGGHIDELELLEAVKHSSDVNKQVLWACKSGAARELYEETGIDVRSRLDRLKPAKLRKRRVNKEGQTVLVHPKNELKNRFFFHLNVDDSDFPTGGVTSMGDNPPNIKVKLSNEHAGFTLHPDVSLAVKMLEMHSGGKVSEALQMAMDRNVNAFICDSRSAYNGDATMSTTTTTSSIEDGELHEVVSLGSSAMSRSIYSEEGDQEYARKLTPVYDYSVPFTSSSETNDDSCSNDSSHHNLSGAALVDLPRKKSRRHLTRIPGAVYKEGKRPLRSSKTTAIARMDGVRRERQSYHSTLPTMVESTEAEVSVSPDAGENSNAQEQRGSVESNIQSNVGTRDTWQSEIDVTSPLKKPNGCTMESESNNVKIVGLTTPKILPDANGNTQDGDENRVIFFEPGMQDNSAPYTELNPDSECLKWDVVIAASQSHDLEGEARSQPELHFLKRIDSSQQDKTNGVEQAPSLTNAKPKDSSKKKKSKNSKFASNTISELSKHPNLHEMGVAEESSVAQEIDSLRDLSNHSVSSNHSEMGSSTQHSSSSKKSRASASSEHSFSSKKNRSRKLKAAAYTSDLEPFDNCGTQYDSSHVSELEKPDSLAKGPGSQTSLKKAKKSVKIVEDVIQSNVADNSDPSSKTNALVEDTAVAPSKAASVNDGLSGMEISDGLCGMEIADTAVHAISANGEHSEQKSSSGSGDRKHGTRRKKKSKDQPAENQSNSSLHSRAVVEAPVVAENKPDSSVETIVATELDGLMRDVDSSQSGAASERLPEKALAVQEICEDSSSSKKCKKKKKEIKKLHSKSKKSAPPGLGDALTKFSLQTMDPVQESMADLQSVSSHAEATIPTNNEHTGLSKKKKVKAERTKGLSTITHALMFYDIQPDMPASRLGEKSYDSGREEKKSDSAEQDAEEDHAKSASASSKTWLISEAYAKFIELPVEIDEIDALSAMFSTAKPMHKATGANDPSPLMAEIQARLSLENVCSAPENEPSISTCESGEVVHTTASSIECGGYSAQSELPAFLPDSPPGSDVPQVAPNSTDNCMHCKDGLTSVVGDTASDGTIGGVLEKKPEIPPVRAIDLDLSPVDPGQELSSWSYSGESSNDGVASFETGIMRGASSDTPTDEVCRDSIPSPVTPQINDEPCVLSQEEKAGTTAQEPASPKIDRQHAGGGEDEGCNVEPRCLVSAIEIGGSPEDPHLTVPCREPMINCEHALERALEDMTHLALLRAPQEENGDLVRVSDDCLAMCLEHSSDTTAHAVAEDDDLRTESSEVARSSGLETGSQMNSMLRSDFSSVADEAPFEIRDGGSIDVGSENFAVTAAVSRHYVDQLHPGPQVVGSNHANSKTLNCSGDQGRGLVTLDDLADSMGLQPAPQYQDEKIDQVDDTCHRRTLEPLPGAPDTAREKIQEVTTGTSVGIAGQLSDLLDSRISSDLPDGKALDNFDSVLDGQESAPILEIRCVGSLGNGHGNSNADDDLPAQCFDRNLSEHREDGSNHELQRKFLASGDQSRDTVTVVDGVNYLMPRAADRNHDEPPVESDEDCPLSPTKYCETSHNEVNDDGLETLPEVAPSTSVEINSYLSECCQLTITASHADSQVVVAYSDSTIDQPPNQSFEIPAGPVVVATAKDPVNEMHVAPSADRNLLHRGEDGSKQSLQGEVSDPASQLHYTDLVEGASDAEVVEACSRGRLREGDDDEMSSSLAPVDLLPLPKRNGFFCCFLF